MRVLFCVQAATGHLQPLIPLGHALRARGHEVAVVCPPSFCPAVAACGLDPLPAGLDWLRAEAERWFPALAALAPHERYAWILAHVYADLAPRRLFPELVELCRAWRPDVLVRDQMEFASWLAAEKLGLPHASYGYGLGFEPPDRCVVAPPLDRLRREVGLPSDPELAGVFRYLRFEFAPRSYLAAGAAGGAVRHHLRHVPSDCAAHAAPPDWLARLGRRPVVVATLGNNYNRTPGLFELIAEALADEPVDVILTIGRNRTAHELGALPPNVRVEQYVPLSQLLPRASLTVCHAGFNTLFTAVAAGTPLVLVPIDSDQPAAARRCRALGLGVLIERGDLTAERLRLAVREALHGTRYRRAVARFRRELEALPDAAHAASLLERLVGTRQSEEVVLQARPRHARERQQTRQGAEHEGRAGAQQAPDGRP